MGNQPGRNGESKEGKPERRHGGSQCEAEAGRTERKNIRLSSRKGSGSGRKEAEAERKMPEEKRKRKRRQALVEQLWERSEEG